MVFCFLVGKAPRYLPRLHYALLVLKFCYDWLNVLSSDVALFFVWKALTKALQSVGSNFGPGFKDLFVDFFTPPQKKNIKDGKHEDPSTFAALCLKGKSQLQNQQVKNLDLFEVMFCSVSW